MTQARQCFVGWVKFLPENSFAQINDFSIRRILRNNIVASVSGISFN